jgi:NOL1/NOP2/sun family putative RNA methylase
MNPPIPPDFEKRMAPLLGEETAAFLAALSQPPYAGLRLNRLKSASPEILPFQLEPVPWCSDGFYLPNAAAERPGRHPYHAAGLYYLQETSAMAALALLDPRPGERVLDLCAAPGGKAGQIAAALQGQGLLVANDVVRSRAAILAENLERLGVTNSLVTNSDGRTLAAIWPGAFDRVLVDAPCSGEGMFGKSAAARQEWRPTIVTGCAARQEGILLEAADLVRPGGRLLYSTCTFAPAENERVIARFLHARPDFELVEPPPMPGLSPGRPDWIEPALAHGRSLEHCRRIWPHKTVGEGHFLALLQRQGAAAAPDWPVNDGRLPAKALVPLRQFWSATMNQPLPNNGLLLVGEQLYWAPVNVGKWAALRPYRPGWLLGKLAGSRFVPGHALALGVQAAGVQQRLDLTADSPQTTTYLGGETVAAVGSDGWLLVTVDGFPLGWGKRSRDVVKNHYPRQLRRNW